MTVGVAESRGTSQQWRHAESRQSRSVGQTQVGRPRSEYCSECAGPAAGILSPGPIATDGARAPQGGRSGVLVRTAGPVSYSYRRRARQSRRCAERGLELVPVADATTFSWPGRGSPAAWRDASGPHGVVTFGVPSGAIWDPGAPRQAPAAGFSLKGPLSSRRRAAPRAP